jgi:hypothetical protein
MLSTLRMTFSDSASTTSRQLRTRMQRLLLFSLIFRPRHLVPILTPLNMFLLLDFEVHADSVHAHLRSDLGSQQYTQKIKFEL